MHSATKEEEEIYRETERIYREIIAICSEFKRGIENAGAIGDEERRGWMMGVGEEGRGSEVHSSVNMGDAGFV